MNNVHSTLEDHLIAGSSDSRMSITTMLCKRRSLAKVLVDDLSEVLKGRSAWSAYFIGGILSEYYLLCRSDA